jgi:predicted HicB family RNase H-like nuclease
MTTAVERDIVRALLGRLRERGLISEEEYLASCSSRSLEPVRLPDPARGRER